MPAFDLTTMRFGGLSFGDQTEAARFLGRPERARWIQKDYCELLYAARGFQVDFEKDKFVYLAFFVGPCELGPDFPDVQFSQPKIHAGTAADFALSQNTDRALLERIFGEPDGVDVDETETILSFFRQGMELEFELAAATGKLKRWSVFPE